MKNLFYLFLIAATLLSTIPATAQNCNVALDVHIANDVSGSVDSREHQQSKQFITALGLNLSPLGIGDNQSRISISQWSHGNYYAEYSFPVAGPAFTTLQSDLIAYTNSARPFGGSTNPYKALLKAYEWVQQDPIGGTRDEKPIIVLMTDAWASQVPSNISSLATQIKNSGITIVVMAIDAAASVTALQGTKVASPDAYFAAADYATLQNDALAYINNITNVTCGPADPFLDLSPAISSFEITGCTGTPSATLNYTITNSGNTDFNSTLDLAFYNGNPTVPGTQYLFTESISPPSINKYGGTYGGSTSNVNLLNTGTVYAVVNINGSLPANAVPLSPTLNGATLTVTETSTGNNISSAFTRTDGIGCLPYAHIDVQVSHSGQVCDNQLIYYVEVCNIGTADFEMEAIPPYADASFLLEETQLVGTDPFVGSTLPAGACATYHYTYDLDGATAGTTYHFSVDVKEWLPVTCPDNPTTVVDVEAGGYMWMDRNLGASQKATSSTDAASYGDLYQWGRDADCHQLRTSVTTTNLATTAEPSLGNVWDGRFILGPTTSPYDWLATQDDNLWQGVSGTNNPCPAGYRLPTDTELDDIGISSIGEAYTALGMPAAGYRNYSSGSISYAGSRGYYWSSTVSGIRADRLYFTSTYGSVSGNYRAYGMSVRCLKDSYVNPCQNDLSGGTGDIVLMMYNYNGVYNTNEYSWCAREITPAMELAAHGSSAHLSGKTWLDRNLGAYQYATEPEDAASYGDLYQWGRAMDGHAKRVQRTGNLAEEGGGNQGTMANGTTTTQANNPTHALSIAVAEDWRVNQNDNLWAGTGAVNNPCPAGFRLPTVGELTTLEAWVDNSQPYDERAIYDTELRLPLSGFRYQTDPQQRLEGHQGRIWSSTGAGTTTANNFYWYSNESKITNSSRRAAGVPVRCLKD